MALEDTLRQITGADRVFDSPEVLEAYSRDNSFAPRIRPRCIVKPISTREVQQIVGLANDTGTPLVPVSSGPFHSRGDTVPSIGGAVIVDLNSMNRIIRIDSKNKVALVEPGVTFGRLAEALKKEGLAPYTPLAPNSSKSVLTSYLEREPITIPRDHWETQDPLICTEVVYGSGDLFRTGSAAGPGTMEEQWEVGRAMVRGMGPAQTDFAKLTQAAQGTMGILTWASVKVRRLPAIHKTYLVGSEDLSALIRLVYRVLWKRIGNHVMLLNSHNLASLLSPADEEIRSIRARLPAWVFVFSIEGTGLLPEERVAWMDGAFVEEARKYGLEPGSAIAGLESDKVVETLTSPSGPPYWKVRYRGGCHDIFFLTTLDKAPQFIDLLRKVARSLKYPAVDVGIYLQPTIQGTNCHCEFNLPYNPQNSEEVERVKAIDRQAVRLVVNMGGFFSRPYGAWASVAFGRDPASVVGLRKVKTIFDPNGVMNPGKLCF
jgi:FAD/FMN-containing dehydrogenase